jgi:hypothetical protein
LVNRRNAIKEEVTMGLNLMADDTPHVNFAEYGYSIGIGAYGESSETICSEGEFGECYD